MQEVSPEARASRRSVPLWVWLALAALIGAIVGLGAYTFAYAEGASYLTNDPDACMNCHVMRDQYEGWLHGPHSTVAACNDCHAPHNSVVAKYAVKGINGFRHSLMFTTGAFEEPIRITGMNLNVTEHACLYCHADVTAAMSHANTADPTDCLLCHGGIGHGR